MDTIYSQLYYQLEVNKHCKFIQFMTKLYNSQGSPAHMIMVTNTMATVPKARCLVNGTYVACGQLPW